MQFASSPVPNLAVPNLAAGSPAIPCSLSFLKRTYLLAVFNCCALDWLCPSTTAPKTVLSTPEFPVDIKNILWQFPPHRRTNPEKVILDSLSPLQRTPTAVFRSTRTRVTIS
jgi:hypothetical protein